MISLDFDFSKLNAKLDRFVKIVANGARPAAQAGAQVFYEEMRERASTAGGDGRHSAPGAAPFVQSGDLRDAIYQAYAEKDSGIFSATYRISFNKEKAWYGRLLENGTSTMAARPFIRPSYDAKRADAVRAVNERLFEEVKKGVK